MDFLSSGRGVGRDDDFVVGQAGCAAAAFAEDGDGGQALLLRGLQGQDQVVGVAAGGEHHQRISRLPNAFHLPGKELVKSIVIPNAGLQRRVGG